VKTPSDKVISAIIKMKLNMYSVWHNYLFFYYFCYWLLVSVSMDHQQANIY